MIKFIGNVLYWAVRLLIVWPLELLWKLVAGAFGLMYKTWGIGWFILLAAVLIFILVVSNMGILEVVRLLESVK